MSIFDNYALLGTGRDAITKLAGLKKTDFDLLILYIAPRINHNNCFENPTAKRVTQILGLAPHQLKTAMARLIKAGLIVPDNDLGWMVDPNVIYSGTKHRYPYVLSKWNILSYGETYENRQDNHAQLDPQAQDGSSAGPGCDAPGTGGPSVPAEGGHLDAGLDETDLPD